MQPVHEFLCPNHEDEHPSCRVFEDGHVHCYVCGYHASRIKLVYDTMFRGDPNGYVLANAWLERYQGRAPVSRPRPRVREKPEAPAHVLAAIRFYCDAANRRLSVLPDLVQEIKAARGLHDPVGLGLGLSDEGVVRNVRQKLRAVGFTSEVIEEALRAANLISGAGNYVMGKRLVIPEYREGKAIFFQARTLEGHDPKYNNPRVPKPLYGLESVDKGEVLYLAEGTMDVLPLIEAGQSAVAILGSEVRFEQVLPLVHDRPVVLAFDRDAAGDRIAHTLTEQFKLHEVEVHRIPPPEPYKDYGEWVAAKGAAAVVEDVEWSR